MGLSTLLLLAAPVSQDLSVAGKRAGLEGDRSGLFYQAIRIIKEMRNATNEKYPRFIVWENVPGALNSSNGEDFRTVLEEICKIKNGEISLPRPDGRWTRSGEIVDSDFSLAWRTLDSQYWGVPQRRFRIYLVADFAGQSAGKILFEREGLSGYTQPSGCPWQSFAGNSEDRSGETDRSTYCINPQGSSGVTITENQTATLISQDHGHHPAVLQAAGFCTEHSADSRGIGYEEEKSPTLRAGITPAVVAFDNHGQTGQCEEAKEVSPPLTAFGLKSQQEPLIVEAPIIMYDNHAQDGRYDELDKAPTVVARYGTGGNNQPLVAEPITLKIRCGKPGGGKGPLLQVNKSATLGTSQDQTLFQPVGFDGDVVHTLNAGANNDDPMVFQDQGSSQATISLSRVAYNGGEKANFGFAVNEEVAPTIEAAGPPTVAKPEIKAYGVCSKHSNSMKSDNPNAGFYEAKASRTLDQHGGNPTCNQGGIAVVTPTYSLQGSMIGREEKNGPRGSGVDEEVSFTLNTADRHGVCCATTGSFMSVSEDVASPLMARDWKDPQIVVNYVIRRLTPLECSRLQGFPDWWCDDLAIPDPSPEELEFWKDVWETWRKATNPSGKPKTEKQIRKWLANPCTDNEVYKMWGNGVALPCPYFVLSGIAWAVNGLEAVNGKVNDLA